ncbi:MAG TPA: hypothetical protein O0W90_02315 [Methanocorpusculum sp.]|nr:hypothetical protein [Methanocorpusculum sp.]
MGRITISDLHGYLIDERNSGSLSEVPSYIYEDIRSDIISLTNQIRSCEDRFSEGVQSTYKEIESLREYLKSLYDIRTKKIVDTALAAANGEQIDRIELQRMVPGERMLFDVVNESALSCRKTLLDGKPILETTAYNYVLPETEVLKASPEPKLEETEYAKQDKDESVIAQADIAEKAPEEYRVVAVNETIPEFQDINGRIYSLSPGDIVSLPEEMADILCKDNKALSIIIRK